MGAWCENRVIHQVQTATLHTESAIKIAIIPSLEITDTSEIITGVPGMDDVGGWHQSQAGIPTMIVGIKTNLDHLVIFGGVEPGIACRGIGNIPSTVGYLELVTSSGGNKKI